jgi:hypothetical protein
MNHGAMLLIFLGMSAAPSAPAQNTIVVRGPTVVAFCPPVTEKQLETDEDMNEVLADFQLYAARVGEPLKKAGIDFHQVYAWSFRVRTGTKVVTFRTGKVEIGYYFIAPGKKPRIEYGVDTDDGLLQIAHEYFGILAK